MTLQEIIDATANIADSLYGMKKSKVLEQEDYEELSELVHRLYRKACWAEAYRPKNR
jgi:hypothetical protein